MNRLSIRGRHYVAFGARSKPRPTGNTLSQEKAEQPV